MNVTLIVFILCGFCAKAFDQGDGIASVKNFRELSENDDDSYEFEYGTMITNVLFKKTVKKFNCGVERDDSVLLVNGAKSWKFPRQAVNLTLTYPTADASAEYGSYTISSFQVILFTDGESKGYITSGGILQPTISLSFVSRNISTLSYNFKVYGIQSGPEMITQDSVTDC